VGVAAASITKAGTGRRGRQNGTETSDLYTNVKKVDVKCRGPGVQEVVGGWSLAASARAW
jgi:hypothetical protein